MVSAVHPYLNFPGNTEEAFGFYRSVFGGDFAAVLRYRDFPDNAMGVPEAELDKIAHLALPLSRSSMLMGTDVVGAQVQGLQVGTNSYIVLDPDDDVQARSLFDALSAGGSVEMPLQSTEWAELYGILRDRYGIQWMVNYAGKVQFSQSA